MQASSHNIYTMQASIIALVCCIRTEGRTGGRETLAVGEVKPSSARLHRLLSMAAGEAPGLGFSGRNPMSRPSCPHFIESDHIQFRFDT
jgi:hypothetical protein